MKVCRFQRTIGRRRRRRPTAVSLECVPRESFCPSPRVSSLVCPWEQMAHRGISGIATGGLDERTEAEAEFVTLSEFPAASVLSPLPDGRGRRFRAVSQGNAHIYAQRCLCRRQTPLSGRDSDSPAPLRETTRRLDAPHAARSPRPPAHPTSQFNIAYPPAGTQKKLDIDDENKLRAFYDKRISAEVDGEHLGEEFKGYIVKIMGGHDKQGFAMKQGVLTVGRVQVLLSRGQSGFKGYGRRNGERRRKSVRGCIVSHEISTLNLVIVKKGENDIPGLTDTEVARPRGPKRASKIRKMFNLTKDDDVRHYVKIYGRKIEKDGKTRLKCPKIQRLVTPQRLQRKRAIKAEKMAKIAKRKSEQAAYHKVIVARVKEERERRSESMAKKRAVRQASQASRDA